MTGKPGVYLTPEQSLRLAMADNFGRERMIAAIVARLRKAVQAGKVTPREWYRSRPKGM